MSRNQEQCPCCDSVLVIGWGVNSRTGYGDYVIKYRECPADCEKTNDELAAWIANEYERREQRSIERYYGGEGPASLSEQIEECRKFKRSW